MRHGLTIGELAKIFNEHFGIGCELEVVPMSGWKRSMYFSDTGLPWVAPSPNMPTPDSAVVYPGQVIWEGTNVSEGRGTTQPFELFGAPYVDNLRLLPELGDVAGATLRPVVFEPTSNKWKNRLCRGFQIHITDRCRYRPYITTLGLLQAILRYHRDEFEWKPPPYEYEYERLAIDLIIGDQALRERIEALDSLDDIAGSWQEDLERFTHLGRRFYQYN
jgi:uncharacterized protein YbbC (DUF1343 family)